MIELTYQYDNLTGCEQGWTMFTPNLGPAVGTFLGINILFSDGSEEVVPSINEPDPRGYVRLGGARMRKLEGQLVRSRRGA